MGRSKAVVGTDGYIAPEAYLGDVCPKSDIFSTGVVPPRKPLRGAPPVGCWEGVRLCNSVYWHWLGDCCESLEF